MFIIVNYYILFQNYYIFSYPVPIGSFAYDLLETIINEMYFQGINILNSLQRKFYIDTYFGDGNNIDISDYNRVFILQSKIKFNSINSLSPVNYFQELTNKILKNIAGFVDWKSESIIKNIDKNEVNSGFICENGIFKEKEYLIYFNEFLVKILINCIYNLKDEIEINSDNLKKLIYHYYIENAQKDKNKINNNIYLYESETNDLEGEKSLRLSIEFLIKIINIGLDKEKSEFDYDIREIINSILTDISQKSNLKDILENKQMESLFKTDSFTPLTEYNKKLQNYSYNLVDNEKDDFFEVYLALVKNILVKNFIPNSFYESEQDITYFKSINTNLIKEIKMNILLVEEEFVQNNIYDDTDNYIKNVSSLTNYINRLYMVNKNLDNFYENTQNKSNSYKPLIDDFFETFNFDNKINKIFSNTQKEDNFESTQIHLNLETDTNFKLNFNYIIYLLPGNLIDLFCNENTGKNDAEKNYINETFINFNSTILNSRLTSAKKESLNLSRGYYNQNLCNTSFLCRYIAKKDYIYKTLISNLWSNINFEEDEDEFINAKRYQILKENINFYINEAENIFNLYLFKIELFKTSFLIINLNKTLTTAINESIESVDFLFWKNLKIIRKEDEVVKKKGNETNYLNLE